MSGQDAPKKAEPEKLKLWNGRKAQWHGHSHLPRRSGDRSGGQLGAQGSEPFAQPRLLRGLPNLVQDLHDRGLDQDVVTVVWGEFGRTPKINAGAGHDHWVQVMSAIVAGGGSKMGQAIGATSTRAEVPLERPYSIAQVLGTLYRAIDVDPGTALTNGSGRPVPILNDREPIKELL